jgi:hypothetical protein
MNTVMPLKNLPVKTLLVLGTSPIISSKSAHTSNFFNDVSEIYESTNFIIDRNLDDREFFENVNFFSNHSSQSLPSYP